MKKILGLTVVALMVMGLVGGGTWAYFSDVETSTGNTFGAGTLDLTVDSENPWASAPISVSNIAPGDSSTSVNITATNSGSLAGDLYVRINGYTDAGGDNPEPEQVKEAEIGVTDNISAKLTLNVTGPGGADTNIDGLKIDAADGTWSAKIADLAPAGEADIEISATLDSDATNEYQGDNCTFTIELYLQQDGQGAPSP
jgi:predicted ribosomally synthesized peptide with SipW-like signal peptide